MNEWRKVSKRKRTCKLKNLKMISSYIAPDPEGQMASEVLKGIDSSNFKRVRKERSIYIYINPAPEIIRIQLRQE